LDANGAWDLETAERRLAEIAPLRIELIEQPVASLDDAARLAERTEIPIAADESIESRADAERALAAGACSLTGIKLSKVGGPEEAIEIAELLPAYMTSALDGPVGIAAAAQVAATLESPESGGTPIAHGLATQLLFSSTVAAAECEVIDGEIRLPAGPGLGVEIDEEALQAHRL
jgi:L-alanine-DL-glutamate epimerase-like enolase superfamily enzyme